MGSVRSSIETTFIHSLFVGLSVFTFNFNNWKARSNGQRSGDWPGHWRISHFFALRNSRVGFALWFESCTVWSVIEQLSECEQRAYGRTFQNSSCCFSDPVPLPAIHAYATQMMHWCVTSWACFSPSPLFYLPIELIQVHFGFMCPSSLQTCEDSQRFSGKVLLAFLYLSGTSGHEISREGASPGHETSCQSTVQLLSPSLWK